MDVEDQLTRDERVRLEALNQAVACNTMRNVSTELIVAQAKEFERFVRGEEQDRG